jgi:hypothetical protein
MPPLHKGQPPSTPPLRRGPHQPVKASPLLEMAAEALLEATVSVPWERPVHAGRLAFLRRVARLGEVSVHVACGIDRLGFIDVACGLTTILTDIDPSSLAILAQQFAELEARFGPLPGSLQCRQLPVEALTTEKGFPPGSVHHLTLQNLFNAHLHPTAIQPRVIDVLLPVVASGGSFFVTESEAMMLQRQAQARQMRLIKLGEIQGYYDENVVLFRLHRMAA